MRKRKSKGLSSVEIGEKVFISPLTVETHRKNLLQKFKVANVAALHPSSDGNEIYLEKEVRERLRSRRRVYVLPPTNRNNIPYINVLDTECTKMG